MTPGLAAFKLTFQCSPILFVGGIAKNIPGQMLPIIALTEAANFIGGIVSGGINIELDGMFCTFQALPGGTLIDNQIGNYPFANQTVAANAIIQQPLQLSMMMICPARDRLGYGLKLLTMTALRIAFENHNSSGGTYNVMTPACIYTNGIMTGMRDTSLGQSHQAQNTYQLDFTFPLLTLNQAQQAQNSLMAQITGQTQVTDPAWSGSAAGLGPTGANTLAAPSLIPAASGVGAAGISPSLALG